MTYTEEEIKLLLRGLQHLHLHNENEIQRLKDLGLKTEYIKISIKRMNAEQLKIENLLDKIHQQ